MLKSPDLSPERWLAATSKSNALFCHYCRYHYGAVCYSFCRKRFCDGILRLVYQVLRLGVFEGEARRLHGTLTGVFVVYIAVLSCIAQALIITRRMRSPFTYSPHALNQPDAPQHLSHLTGRGKSLAFPTTRLVRLNWRRRSGFFYHACRITATVGPC